MKTAKALAATLILVAFTAIQTQAADPDLTLPKDAVEMTKVDWAGYGDRLVQAIQSDNDGLVQSALQLSIRYAETIDVSDAIVDMMHVYRDHADDRVRHLAAVALASTNDELALGYLRLSSDYESSPSIKRTLKALTAPTS